MFYLNCGRLPDPIFTPREKRLTGVFHANFLKTSRILVTLTPYPWSRIRPSLFQ